MNGRMDFQPTNSENMYAFLITVYLLKPLPIIVPLFNAESDMIFDVNFDGTSMVLMLQRHISVNLKY